jgi:hypothetical protein
MGTHAAPTDKAVGAFGKEFIDATKTTFNYFEKHKGKDITGYADIIEINYSDFFDKIRNQMADESKSVAVKLAAVASDNSAELPLDLSARLTNWQGNLSADTFFNNDWLDVIFYGTMIRNRVIAEACEQIAAAIQKYQANNIHIIAHSLGTGVAHDSLNRLYNPPDETPKLSIANDKIGSLWMFANVSRLTSLLTNLADPLKTVVRPGKGGCTTEYYNISHKLDPFTWQKKFDPKPDDGWISSSFNWSFTPLETELIHDYNTHSFSQYVSDPLVVNPLFSKILEDKFATTEAEFDKFAAKHAETSIQGAYSALQDSISALPKDVSSWNDVVNSAKAFYAKVEILKKAKQ